MSLALGWSLLHFIWQGALAAALLATANLFLRRSRPEARYLAAATTLVVMLALPVATFEVLSGRPRPISETGTSAAIAVEPRVVTTAPPTGAELVAGGPRADFAAWRPRIEPLLPGLVVLWGAGVFFLSLRGLGGWAVVQRLRRSGLATPPAAIDASLTRLLGALRVPVPVRLYQSALVQVPTALGWLRPVGLSAGMLIEMRRAGVTPEFALEIKKAGFENLKPEELIELRRQGVGGELLRRLRGRQ